MLSRQLVKLTLAVALCIGLVTALSTTMNAGKTASKNPITRKILRRHGKTKGEPTAAEVALLKKQQKEERKFEDGIPKHVPVKVKIKKEKEESFKEFDNEHWLRDIEIEVTNTGTKPIYFLDIRLSLPDTRGPDGNIIAWPLLFGRTDLSSVTEPLKPTDIPLKPGETHVFTIEDRFVIAWEGMVREGQLTQAKRVQVMFQLITFGDGTGYWGGTAAPLPHSKRPLAAAPCVNDKTNEERSPPKSRFAAWNSSSESWLSNRLPAFLPAKFLVPEPTGNTLEPTGKPPVCCPGTSCTWAKQTLHALSVFAH